MNSNDLERYARQIILKEVGGAGQQALSRARIAMVGAGGLGGPAAMYLASAGVGHITLIDNDEVSLSNLQRQIQFTTDQIGQTKTQAAKAGLEAINPGVSVTAHNARLDANNAAALLDGHDIILDGCDNFETRFAVNDAGLASKTPLVSGAVGRWDGQVGSFKNDGASPCYRCFVPNIPPDAEACAEVGVVGALTGIIGSLMALEVIKIVTGAGVPLYGKLMVFDGLGASARTLKLHRDKACSHHG